MQIGNDIVYFDSLKKLRNLLLTEMLNLFGNEAINSVMCRYFALYLANIYLKKGFDKLP